MKQDAEPRQPPCLHCRHLALRQGLAHPYVCTLWGIRTRAGTFPAREVFLSTGKHCPYFLQREKVTKHPDQGQDDNHGVDQRV